MHKTKWLLLGAILVVALMGLAGCTVSNPTITVPTSQQSTGIWVSGEGKVMAAPDVAILSLGIEAQAKTVAEAQNQATGAMTKVMQALTSSDIKDKDIQTQRFSIYPVTRWLDKENRQEITGYRVTNTVTAKIRDLAKAGAVIDAVAAAGGDFTRIQDISFTIENPDNYYKEARSKAVTDAATKAKQLADVAGIKLGKITYISEGTAYVPQTIRVKALDSYNEAGSASVPTPVSPGEMEIRLSLQMVYEIQ